MNSPGSKVILTQNGTLLFEDSQDHSDWRESLFRLGAGSEPQEESLCFWHKFAKNFFLYFQRAAAECYSLEELDREDINSQKLVISLPTNDLFEDMIEQAPPLVGGEYLESSLPEIWVALTNWLIETISVSGGPNKFLTQYAPLWHGVGRVYFHLAENKDDPDFPFAFLASYTSGLTARGLPQHKSLGDAVIYYTKASDRDTLLRLLTPVVRASKKIPWLASLNASHKIFRPCPFTAKQAWQFLQDIPVLEQNGLWISIPDWWKKRPRAQIKVVLETDRVHRLDTESVLSFKRTLILGEEELSENEWAKLMASDGLVFIKGHWVEVDQYKLKAALDHWKMIEKEVKNGSLSFSKGMRLLAGMPADFKKDDGYDESDRVLSFEAGEALAGLLARMRETPTGSGHWSQQVNKLRKLLRPYQIKGADWLLFMSSLGLGGCLADDMGLGKTIQVLTLLLHEKFEKKVKAPSLLVLPASLLGNWRKEVEKFSPDLKLLFVHRALGDNAMINDMASNPNKFLPKCDIVVTTYAMLVRQPWLREIDWNLVIADEAQAVKNPLSLQTKALKALKAQARLALTGTPVENSLGDLWSMLDFINPGLLGTKGEFKRYTGLLSRRQAGYGPLKKLVSPYILRRLKTDRKVISDLPDKIENINYCGLSNRQAALYEKTVKALALSLDKSEGIARRGLILQTLLRLKQICNHPDQLQGAGAFSCAESGKFLRLSEICQELAERQEKVLIFTQFREIIEPLCNLLNSVFGRSGLILHGGTKAGDRQRLVDEFQAEGGPPFFLLSLKAGGTGLNLTAAARVIHFDRWWNPAVENQATDRAFRIGQKKNVMVHKFVCAGTVEEKIHQIILDKSQLAEEIIDESERQVDLTSLSNEAILSLVKMDIATFNA